MSHYVRHGEVVNITSRTAISSLRRLVMRPYQDAVNITRCRSYQHLVTINNRINSTAVPTLRTRARRCYTGTINIVQRGICNHTSSSLTTNCHIKTPYFFNLARRARGSNFLGASAASDLSAAATALRASAILSLSLAISKAASMYASDFSATSIPDTSLT
ncbi:JK_27P [Escherichia phage Jk06]|uniref:JK_27P n=1 Tax=Escherichia phage Jk06 TaxID=2886922 RepID=Q45PY8_9CAUD|nr:hypothetical protein JK_27 [Escherichia phage Jk06]AAZ29277.1 JK_27P [Escherichia phage Jk06]